jgi:hypothetical protein
MDDYGRKLTNQELVSRFSSCHLTPYPAYPLRFKTQKHCRRFFCRGNAHCLCSAHFTPADQSWWNTMKHMPEHLNTMMQTWTWCTQVVENQELKRNYIDFPEQTSSLLCQSFFGLWVAPVIKTRLIPCQICKEHQLLQLLSGTNVTCRWEPCQAAWTNKRGPLYSTKTRMEIFFEQIQTNWDSGKLTNFTNTCALFAVYHEQISDTWFDTIRLRQPLKSHWDFGKPKIW